MLNFEIKIFSELKPFTTFNPLSVSSKIEICIPFSSCALVDFDFKFFPTLEIINPEIGMNKNTNNVSFALIRNIAIIENKMVNGSLTTSSKT